MSNLVVKLTTATTSQKLANNLRMKYAYMSR